MALAEASPDLTQTARQAHPDPEVSAKAARRWLRRRQDAVHMCLRILRGLLPDQFCGSPPTVLDLQSHLGHASVLQA